MQAAYIARQTAELVRNLLAGMRLATGRPVDPDAFSYSLDQVLWLAVLVLAVEFGSAYLLTAPPAAFDGYGLADLGAGYLLGVMILLVIALPAGADAAAFGRLVSISLAVKPLLLAVATIAYAATAAAPDSAGTLGLVIFGALVAWQVWIMVNALQLLLPVSRLRATGLSALGGLITAASLWVLPPTALWYTADDPAGEALALLNAEDLFYAQDAMLADTVATLAPHRPGITDLYLLGFAGDGRERVFLNEIEFVRDLFDREFQTRGRSALLANHPQAVARYPLANTHNLADALQLIGARIDPEEDLVLVFLTSHGDPDHRLAVDLGPMRMHDLTPGQLRQALDAAGIRWRIVIVSSCYAGGFIAPLQDPNTLVITASAPDRESFGCGARSSFTDFSTAYFQHALPQTRDFITAFPLAAELIADREAQQRRRPSLPQMYVGAAIRSKLAGAVAVGSR